MTARPRSPITAPTPEQISFVEQAMATYGIQTYNYAYRLTGNEADARDLAQEAFIRVFRAWQSFREGTSFLSWIYRIVTNLHRDELRRRKGVFIEPLPEDNQPKSLPRDDAAHDPIATLHERQLSPVMQLALQGLSYDQRVVVVLADIDEYSYQEIAEIVGCSIGTVRSRLHRAREQLRKNVVAAREEVPAE